MTVISVNWGILLGPVPYMGVRVLAVLNIGWRVSNALCNSKEDTGGGGGSLFFLTLEDRLIAAPSGMTSPAF